MAVYILAPHNLTCAVFSMCGSDNTEWFQSWFDSPYYHALYQHRDQDEAATFLSALISHLQLKQDAKLLDLACGKGRHSIFLNSVGYDVTGVDLSACSIQYAQQFMNDRLRFVVQDMRSLSMADKFDCVLNLFTSFGYFQSEDDNVKVLKAVKKHLKPSGIFVLDYFNTNWVSQHLMQQVVKEACGLHFTMNKKIEDGRIIKDIAVKEGEKIFHFTEQVQLLNATMLHALLNKAGLEPVASFGNYQLQPFDIDTSERLIIISINK